MSSLRSRSYFDEVGHFEIYILHLTLSIKENNVEIKLKSRGKMIDGESLTINHGFDTLLISTIDKLLIKNKIDKLSLKSLKIQGKLRPETVSSMILKTIKSALKI